MVAGVPAWKPQATLAEVTTSSRPVSSVTSSPRSALRSTDGAWSAGIRHVEGAVVEGDVVAEPVVQGPGSRVVGEHVEPEGDVTLLAAPPCPRVHDRGTVAPAALVGVHLDVVDERHPGLRAQPESTDRMVAHPGGEERHARRRE